MTKRISMVVVALLALLPPVLTLSSGPASALSTPCTESAQIARIPRYQGGGRWQGKMSCIDRDSGRSGDVNIGHRQLTGRVCLVTMRYGYPLYTLSCGYNFVTPNTYINAFTDIATTVQLGSGSDIVTGQVRT